MDTSESQSTDSQIQHTDDARHRRWLFVLAYLITLLIWPALAILRAPVDPLDFAWQIESNRMGAYIASAVFLWSMFAVVWFFQRISRQQLATLGFNTPQSRDFIYGVGFLLAAYPILVILAWTLEQFGLAIPELVIKALLPVTSAEKLMWIGLSVTAAVCEETVFRGYLIVNGERVLRSRGLAVALSAVAFGIGHYYQGWGGVILITFYGLMFTWLRFRTDSLWACIIAHTLQDVVSGLLGSLAYS